MGRARSSHRRSACVCSHFRVPRRVRRPGLRTGAFHRHRLRHANDEKRREATFGLRDALALPGVAGYPPIGGPGGGARRSRRRRVRVVRWKLERYSDDGATFALESKKHRLGNRDTGFSQNFLFIVPTFDTLELDVLHPYMYMYM